MYIYKDKKRKKFYFVARYNGRSYLRRGFKTKKEALKAYLSFVSTFPCGYHSTLDFIKLYLDNQKNHIKESSFYSLQCLFKAYIIPFFSNSDLTSIDFICLSGWWSWVQSFNISISRKNTILGALKRFFDFLESCFDYSCKAIKKLNPIKDYSIIDIRNNIPKYLEFHEFQLLLNATRNDSYLHLFLEILFFTGLRISQARALQVSCYSRPYFYSFSAMASKGCNRSSHLISPKSKSSSTFFVFPDYLCNEIDKFIALNKLSNKDFLFFGSRGLAIGETTLRNKLIRLFKACNLVFRGFHEFRHTNCSFLFEHGFSLEEIKNHLGHSSIVITRKFYLHETIQKKQSIADFFQSLHEKNQL